MNLALFDFDGTITTRETFVDFINLAVPTKKLLLGKILLAPLVIGYKLGLVSVHTIRWAVAGIGFRGMTKTAAENAGAKFCNEFLPTVIREHAIEKMQWHKAQGDTVVVVSGGFDLYLKHWCQQYGVELICSALEVANGKLTGRYLGEQCVGKEKTRRIHEQYDIKSFAMVYAYGDTREDLDMLNIADKKYYGWQEVT
ncbi:MAG: HAD family hydrolase [Arenimonas sp.]